MDENLEIRDVVPRDIHEIYELEKECFVTPWKPEVLLLDLYGSALNRYFVLVKNEHIIGYVGVNIVLDEAHIRKLCITGNERQKGYAALLLEHAFSFLKDQGVKNVTLEVRESNREAIALYEKNGFVMEGIRPHYYDGRENAVIMWKYGI